MNEGVIYDPRMRIISCIDRNIRPKKFSFYHGQDLNGVWTPMTPTLTVNVNEMSTTQRGKDLKLMKDGEDVHVLWVSVFDRCPFREGRMTTLIFYTASPGLLCRKAGGAEKPWGRGWFPRQPLTWTKAQLRCVNMSLTLSLRGLSQWDLQATEERRLSLHPTQRCATEDEPRPRTRLEKIKEPNEVKSV